MKMPLSLYSLSPEILAQIFHAVDSSSRYDFFSAILCSRAFHAALRAFPASLYTLLANDRFPPSSFSLVEMWRPDGISPYARYFLYRLTNGRFGPVDPTLSAKKGYIGLAEVTRMAQDEENIRILAKLLCGPGPNPAPEGETKHLIETLLLLSRHLYSKEYFDSSCYFTHEPLAYHNLFFKRQVDGLPPYNKPTREGKRFLNRCRYAYDLDGQDIFIAARMYYCPLDEGRFEFFAFMDQLFAYHPAKDGTEHIEARFNSYKNTLRHNEDQLKQARDKRACDVFGKRQVVIKDWLGRKRRIWVGKARRVGSYGATPTTDSEGEIYEQEEISDSSGVELEMNEPAGVRGMKRKREEQGSTDHTAVFDTHGGTAVPVEAAPSLGAYSLATNDSTSENGTEPHTPSTTSEVTPGVSHLTVGVDPENTALEASILERRRHEDSSLEGLLHRAVDRERSRDPLREPLKELDIADLSLQDGTVEEVEEFVDEEDVTGEEDNVDQGFTGDELDVFEDEDCREEGRAQTMEQILWEEARESAWEIGGEEVIDDEEEEQVQPSLAELYFGDAYS